MKKFLLSAIAAVVVFTGCATNPVEIKTPNAIGMDSVDKIGIIEIQPMEVHLPVFPLIDAAAFNAKVDKVKPQIKKIDEKSAKELTAYYVEKIAEQTGKEIVLIPNPEIAIKLNEANFKEYVLKTAAEYDVDILIGINSYMNVSSAAAFGISGKLKMQNDFYIFDSEANLAGHASITSPETQWSGSDFVQYEVVSKQFGYVDLLVMEFFSPVK